MNRKHVSLCVGLLLLATSLTAWAAPPQAAATDSLYKRLGGYDALAAVTDDFLDRLANDKSLGRFFVGQSADSLGKIRQHIVDFLCKATGGPCVYHGRDMKTSHAGLKITEKDWDIMVKHLNATLDKFKVPAKEQSEVQGAVAGLKADIVEEKKKM
jgi:hemoglobin